MKRILKFCKHKFCCLLFGTEMVKPATIWQMAPISYGRGGGGGLKWTEDLIEYRLNFFSCSLKDKNSAEGYVIPGKDHVSMTCKD